MIADGAQEIERRQDPALRHPAGEHAGRDRADDVEEADQRQRIAAVERRDADVGEIGRQVDGDEGDLEAADEEAGDEELVGAVAEGLA